MKTTKPRPTQRVAAGRTGLPSGELRDSNPDLLIARAYGVFVAVGRVLVGS